MALPAKGNLDGTTAGHTTGMFQAAIGDLRDYLANLFGTSGTKADAQKTLGVAVVDRDYSEQLGYNVLTPLIAAVNAIPAITQGTQIHAASLTPKSTTNRMRARMHCPFSTTYSGGQDFGTAALFINGATAARAAVFCSIPIDAAVNVLYLEFEWVPGVLTAQNVTVRVGNNTGSFVLNGTRIGPVLGGIGRSTLILEEITA